MSQELYQSSTLAAAVNAAVWGLLDSPSTSLRSSTAAQLARYSIEWTARMVFISCFNFHAILPLLPSAAQSTTSWHDCRSDIAAKDNAAVQELCQNPWPLSPPRPHPPYLLQLRVLSTRLMRKLYRHPFLILVNFIATLVTAVALGLIFRNAGVDTGGIQNRLGCLFFMLLYLSMMSLSSLPIWRAEKLLFIRWVRQDNTFWHRSNKEYGWNMLMEYC